MTTLSDRLVEYLDQPRQQNSVGKFWFGQVAKCVIQSDFQVPRR